MFVHIGGDVVVKVSEIVVVLDIAIKESSIATREFLELAGAENRLVDISEGSPKSFIVTSDAVYLSPISPPTLRKRAIMTAAM